MGRLEKFVNKYVEIAAFGFEINSKNKKNNSDDYIDYLG